MTERTGRIPDTAALSLPGFCPEQQRGKPGQFAIFWSQTIYMARLCNVKWYRRPNIYLALSSVLLFSLFVSFLWFQLPDEPSSASAVYRVITLHALYFTSMSNLGYFSTFLSDRQERLPVAGKSIRLSGATVWYGRVIGTTPLRLALIILSCALIYPIVGLRPGFNHYLLYHVTFILQALGNTALGMATSAAFRSPSVAIWAAVFINSFNYIFSGVPYSQNQVTWILRWLRFLSPSFYADQLLVFNQFHGREYPNSLITGNAILEQNGWLKVPPSISICGMILLGILYNIMGQSLLVLTSRPRKE